MANRDQVRQNVSRAVQSLDPLDIFLLSQILEVGGHSVTNNEIRESLRLSHQELDAISDRAIRRFVEALEENEDSPICSLIQ